MKTRSLLLLCIIGFSIGAAGFILSSTRPTVQSSAQLAGALLFPDITDQLASAQRITVTHQDKTLVLDRRADGRWGVAERGGYPARTERVRELLTGLTELRLVELRTADPAQWDRLGLENPSAAGSNSNLLRVLDGNNKVIAELIVGRRRVRTQGNLPESIYVRRASDNQALLAEGRLVVDADPQLWLDRDIANISGGRVQRVDVSRAGQTLAIARDADGDLAVVAPQAPSATDRYKLEDTARAFELLSFIDTVPLAQVQGTPVGSAVFTLDTGLRLNVRVIKNNDDVWAEFSASGGNNSDTEAQQLQERFAGWAFRVGVWKEQAFAPLLENLLSEARAAPQAQQPEAPAASPQPLLRRPPMVNLYDEDPE